jgi:hypothetical protein
MIKSVMREHHWTFLIIDELYMDEDDHRGIQFIYNDIKEVTEEMKVKK